MTGFTVNWTGASGATSYTYTFSDSIARVPSSSTSSSATFTGLTAGTSYALVIKAFNGPVVNTESATFSLVTSPTQPNTATSSNITSTGFTATWLGGAGATSYTFELDGDLVTPSSYSLSTPNVVFTGLTPNRTYVLVIKATNVAGTTVSESQFNPSVISGLSLWLDGADPNATGIAPALNSAVTTWKDKTSNNNHYTANGATYANHSETNKNGILFNGSSSGAFQTSSSLSPFTNTNRWSIFTVHTGTNSSPPPPPTNPPQTMWREKDKTFWVRWSGTTGQIRMNNQHLITSTYDGFSGVHCVVGEGSTSKYSMNGTMNTYASGDSLVTNSRISFGSHYTNAHYEGLYGYMNEALIFNTNLSDSDRQKMEGYLAWKWNRQDRLPAGHPYKTFGPLSSLRVTTLS
jgi:hypothetical protein